MTGLSVNKHIYKLLNGDSELKRICSGGIYPLIADENVRFPFIVFSKTSLQPYYAKNVLCGDQAYLSIAVADTNYSNTVDIAERVRLLMELYRDESIAQITLESNTEDYTDDAYVQRLNFKCITLK